MVNFSKFNGSHVVALVLGAALMSGGKAGADQVIPDDLIVQGSACVGLDCLNNESFGFSTIILKENNLRIFFDDTSVSAGFPANKWQITANDSVSGGANFFAIEDITGAKIPFKVTAGAPTSSIFVHSSGRLGLRTSTPVLDVHVTTGNTPAHRLEQTNSSGFSAQTWDIAGNEANFFVRDVTGGSRLPFRIRPGAPTSSLDISATGSVGIGTTSPRSILHVENNQNGMITTFDSGGVLSATRPAWQFGSNGGTFDVRSTPDYTTFTDRFTISSAGNVGIGTTQPGTQLHTTGGVRFAGVPSCATGIVSSANGTLSCLSSSAQFKHVAGALTPQTAFANVMALRPQTGSYRETPDVPEHWLIAEEVAGVDPALVGLHDGKPHVVKTQNVVADLIVVVQEQQRQIEELRRLLAAK